MNKGAHEASAFILLLMSFVNLQLFVVKSLVEVVNTALQTSLKVLRHFWCRRMRNLCDSDLSPTVKVKTYRD